MELFNPFSGVWSVIVYIVAALWVVIPIIIGIPMCIRNKTIPKGYKVGWIIAFLLFGMFAFFLYLVIYSKHTKTDK